MNSTGSSGFTPSGMTALLVRRSRHCGGTVLNMAFSISGVDAVPEPSTWAMLLLGFAGLGFVAHRRKLRPALMAASMRTSANGSVAGELGFEPRQTESESDEVPDITVHTRTRPTVIACKPPKLLIDKQSLRTREDRRCRVASSHGLPRIRFERSHEAHHRIDPDH